MAAPLVLPDAASRKSAVDLPGVLLFFAAAVLAFVLYRPDTNAPFEIIDFSETLPFLTDGRDFSERFRGLVGYYLQHGRAAFALSAGLAAKWTLFEWWTPGWQWTRYFVGLTVVVLAWHFFRTLGANRLGAAFGASLFIVSETVAPGWLRPSLNEPFGTALLLLASLLACGYQANERPVRLAIAIAALLAAMIVVKETLVAATFFPVALALCRGPDGLIAMPMLSTRNRMLVASSAAAIAIAAIPVVWALTQAAPEGYARQFGATDSILSNAAFGLVPALIPFTPISQPAGWLVTLANVAWLFLLMGAWLWSSGNTPAVRRHTRALILLSLALPLARMLVYLPWPIQHPYYSIPFTLGVATIVAISVSLAVSGRPIARVSVISALVLVSLYAGAGAFSAASRYFAVRRLTDSLVTELSRIAVARDAKALTIAVQRVTIQDWWGLGPTLERFGDATGRPLPPGRDLLCADLRDRLSGPELAGALVAAIRWQCPLTDVALVQTVRSTATRVGRPNLIPVRDTLHADIVVGTRAPTSRE